MQRIPAPVHPAVERARRIEELRQRGAQRTPAQAAEAIDLLAAEVADLRRRLDDFAAGRS
jgi:hypothetical protein